MLEPLLAQRIENPLAPGLSPDNPAQAGSLFGDFLSRTITLALVIAAVVFVFFLIIGGIRWITSSGDKTRLEGAKGTITNAIIGIIIVFSVFAVAMLIEGFFNVKILQINFDDLKIK